MTCTSPFAYVPVEYCISTNYTFNVAGTIIVPGYSLPSSTICLLGSNPAHADCPPPSACTWTPRVRHCPPPPNSWSKPCWWTGGVLNCPPCTWVKESWYWYDCWTVSSLEVFPTLTISGSITVPTTMQLSEGVIITETAPTGAPFEMASMTIYSFDFSFYVNGFGYNVPINLGSGITIEELNGEFALSYTLGALTETYTDDGYDYEINMTFNLVLCATPIPPVGWLNIQVVTAFSVTLDGVGIYKTSFSLMCPIISVEEGGE